MIKKLHIDKADKKVDKILTDADNDIVDLFIKVDTELEDETKLVEIILFKAKNNLEEIFLNTQLKLQKTKKS